MYTENLYRQLKKDIYQFVMIEEKMTIVLPQHEREPQSIESLCLMLYHA